MLTRDTAIIRARFLDQWGTTIPVMYDFGPEQPRPTTLHVHFAIKPATTEHHAGDRAGGIMMSHGRAWLTIYAPKSTGEKTLTDTIDKFSKIFRNWQSPDFAINFKTETYGATGTDPQTGYYYAQVSVYYESIRAYTDDV